MVSMSLDHGLCMQLSGLIEQLTTSGQSSLDQEVMKKVKKICKRSDDYVSHTYHLVMTQLKEEHAEIRLSAFQVIEELFKRSHQFRELLVGEFQDFLELTVETDPEYPLPPPKLVAKNLKSQALRAIQGWYDTFADGYKKLALGYNFLKNCKKVDFQQMRIQSQAEQRRQEEEERKKQIVRQTKLNKVDKEMNDMAPEILNCLNELDACFRLLLPDADDFEVHDSGNSLEDSGEDEQNEEGSVSKTHSSSLLKPSCANSSDNSDQTVTTSMVTHADESCSTGSDVTSCIAVVQYSTSTCASGNVDMCSASTTGAAIVKDSKDDCISGHSDSKTLGVSDGGESELGVCDSGKSGASYSQSEHLETVDSAVSDDSDGDEEEFVRAHGLGSRNYNLSITLDTDEFVIKESDDNTDILRNLRDQHRLITGRFLPAVLSWLEILSKNSGSQDKVMQCIDIKRSLESARLKYDDMKINWKQREPKNTDLEDDGGEEEDGFEDVPEKEGYEEDIPEYLKLDLGPNDAVTSSSKKAEDDTMDPTTFASNMNKLRKILQSHDKARSEESMAKDDSVPSTSGAATSRRDDLLKRAPVVEFGVDLLNWGQKVELPSVVKFESLHRFWQPTESKEISAKGTIDMLHARAIEFSGTFEPVKWKCRAHLSNGTLCQRMDRVKCPFHGKIIPRDEKGVPTSQKDLEEVLEKEKKQLQDWQDPEFLRDIQAETGHDLTLGKKGKGKGKGKQRKHPNLTDLREKTNTSRHRLEKKVFNRNSMKRVAEAMDQLDAKIRKEKFGHSFLSTFPNKI